MDKASDFGSEDCWFESCRGRMIFFMISSQFAKILNRNTTIISSFKYLNILICLNWLSGDELRSPRRRRQRRRRVLRGRRRFERPLRRSADEERKKRLRKRQLGRGGGIGRSFGKYLIT
jgi:hypothetical protein